ncbi:MAG: two pore domain potassium channel family protein, partial [Actinobacteria bacterium]
MKRWNRLLVVVVILLIVIFIGTFGYWFIEPISLLDALYMTVITISTVGFREVVPLSAAGKVFTIFLILFGVATVLNIV